MVGVGYSLFHNICALGTIKNHRPTAFRDALLKQQKLANGRVIDDGLGRSRGVLLGDFVERAARNTIASVIPANSSVTHESLSQK
jgi:hypothetical protein